MHANNSPLTLLFLALLAAAHGHGGGAAPDEEVYLAKLKARHPLVDAHVVERDVVGRAPRPTLAARAPQQQALTGILTAGNAALLTQIGSTTFNEPTSALPTTYQAGASVPVAGASALPAGTIVPANYPTLDRLPPTDSPQVQQWLSQIDFSKVPNIPVTQLGGCANASNAQALASASTNGWWTCGGYTRATDVTLCPSQNTWGSSYDDGPSPYTPKLLDYLDQHSLKTTFFVVGSRAISRPQMLQYEIMDGHQLSVHTWSHPYLTTLTNEQIVAELGWTKYAIKQITGLTPNTMRPPYGDIDDRVRAICAQMGLTPIIWTRANGRTFDTQDWQIAAGNVNTSTVLNNFQSILGMANTLGNGFIVLEHDLYQQAVDLAVNFVLPYAQSISPKLTLEPIISCLGKSMSEAYVETATNSTPSQGAAGNIVGPTGAAGSGAAVLTGGIAAASTTTPTKSAASQLAWSSAASLLMAGLIALSMA